MRALLAFATGLLLGLWLVAWHVEARERERALADWTLARVVEQHPDHTALWRAWLREIEDTREFPIWAKLTWEKVRLIRRSYATGRYSQRVLAGMFGVSEVQISYIVHGEQWKEKAR